MEKVIEIFEKKGYSLTWDEDEQNWKFMFNNEKALLNIIDIRDRIIVRMTLRRVYYVSGHYNDEMLAFIDSVNQCHVGRLISVKTEPDRMYSGTHINVISSFECNKLSKLEECITALINDLESLCEDFFRDVPYRYEC